MSYQAMTIPEEQIYQRWDVLPMALREALVSEKYGDIVWKTCEAEHLSDEKTREVARIASWVFLGFLHPEDVANEAKLALGIHPELAARIAGTLNAKVFAPMREELESSYAPPGVEPHYKESSAFAEAAAGRAGAPIVLEDVRHPEAIEQTLENITKAAPEETFFKETPVTLEALGEQEARSKKQEEGAPMPAFDLSSFAPPPPPPAFAADQRGLDADSRGNDEQGATPFILHEEAPAPSLPKIDDFSLDIRPEEFGPSEPEIQKVPQADIEIGASAPADQRGLDADSRGKEQVEPRTVHYGDLRTPLSEITPTADQRGLDPVQQQAVYGADADSRGKEAAPDTPPPPPTNPESVEGPPAPMDAPPAPPSGVIDFSNSGAEPDLPPPPPPASDEGRAISDESLTTQSSPLKPRGVGFFARLFGRKDSPFPKGSTPPVHGQAGGGISEKSSVAESATSFTKGGIADEDSPPPPPPPAPPPPAGGIINLDSFK
jgi:hypothetical protein